MRLLVSLLYREGGSLAVQTAMNTYLRTSKTSKLFFGKLADLLGEILTWVDTCDRLNQHRLKEAKAKAAANACAATTNEDGGLLGFVGAGFGMGAAVLQRGVTTGLQGAKAAAHAAEHGLEAAQAAGVASVGLVGAAGAAVGNTVGAVGNAVGAAVRKASASPASPASSHRSFGTAGPINQMSTLDGGVGGAGAEEAILARTVTGEQEVREGDECELEVPDMLVVKLMQLMCEGHYLPNQQVFKEQPFNEHNSFDLLELMVNIVTQYSPIRSRSSTVVVSSVCELILEVLQGPCLLNQVCLPLLLPPRPLLLSAPDSHGTTGTFRAGDGADGGSEHAALR